MINSLRMRKALQAVREMPDPDFDPYNSPGWPVYRYPQHYQFVRGAHRCDDIYVELKDKHNWIEAHEVEKVRKYYEGSTTQG